MPHDGMLAEVKFDNYYILTLSELSSTILYKTQNQMMKIVTSKLFIRLRSTCSRFYLF